MGNEKWKERRMIYILAACCKTNSLSFVWWEWSMKGNMWRWGQKPLNLLRCCDLFYPHIWLPLCLLSLLCPSGKCRSVVQGGPERSWSTKGGRGPRGPPGPLWSALIHTFGNFTKNVDQGGSGWTRRTRGTITPLGGPSGFYILLMPLSSS